MKNTGFVANKYSILQESEMQVQFWLSSCWHCCNWPPTRDDKFWKSSYEDVVCTNTYIYVCWYIYIYICDIVFILNFYFPFHTFLIPHKMEVQYSQFDNRKGVVFNNNYIRGKANKPAGWPKNIESYHWRRGTQKSLNSTLVESSHAKKRYSKLWHELRGRVTG